MSIQYVSDPRGQQLTQRPFSVTWFYHQLAMFVHRLLSILALGSDARARFSCLLLWENDASLGDVLELAKSFLVPLDVMNALWPCERAFRPPCHVDCADFDFLATVIQLQCTALRKRLTAHCRAAGHEPPTPPNYDLPMPRRNP